LLARAFNSSGRISTITGVIPAITCKVVLVYDGEQESAGSVALQLINDAVKTTFPQYFPKIAKLQKNDEKTPYDDLIQWFFDGQGFELLDDASELEYKATLDSVEPLTKLINEFVSEEDQKDLYFFKELVLWGLVENEKLSKKRFTKGYQFKDLYGGFVSGL